MLTFNLLKVFLGNLIRYFIVTFTMFYVLKSFFRKFKIQKKHVSTRVIKKEVFYSFLDLIVLSVTSYIVMFYDFKWAPKFYFDYMEHSLSFHFFALLALIFFQDFYFYWIHRLLHTDWFYKHIHYIHHKFTNPTPFTYLAHHPLDLFMQSLGYYIFVFIVPMHPADLIINSVMLTFMNVYGHAGYELLPKGFTRNSILKYINTSTNHNMHHSHNRCNYGLWFTIWDRTFGTLHPDYDDYFDERSQDYLKKKDK